jgi:hypothetical protein
MRYKHFGRSAATQTCSVSKDSSLSSSKSSLASLREVWRAVGTERTRTLVIRSRRRIPISSPGFTVWADFAGFSLMNTSPASHNFCAIVRRWQRRLALRKRSRRIQVVKALFSISHLLSVKSRLICNTGPILALRRWQQSDCAKRGLNSPKWQMKNDQGFFVLFLSEVFPDVDSSGLTAAVVLSFSSGSTEAR